MTLVSNASLYQGEHKVLRDTIYTDGTKTERQNLTGATVVCRIGLKGVAETTVLRVPAAPATTVNGSTAQVIDANEGLLTVTLMPLDTLALAASRYWYQVIVTDSAGRVNLVTDGYLTVKDALPV